MRKVTIKYWCAMLLLGITCILLISCLLISCSKQKEEKVEEDSLIKIEEGVTQRQVDEDEPLVVFYLSQTVGKQMPIVLHNFMLNHPEIDLVTCNIRSYFPNLDLMETIKRMIQQVGDPDIWLLDNADVEMRTLIDELYDMGMVADISSFYTEDESVYREDYVGGTFEVLNTEKGLLGLPLNWGKEGLIIRESMWKNSELEDLPEDYTGEELYRALIRQFNIDRDENELFWTEDSFELMNMMHELDVLKCENDEYFVDEEIFELLYEFWVKRINQDRDAEEMHKKMQFAATGDPDAFQGCPALDPYMYAGDYFGCALWGAPPITTIYTKSTIELSDEDVHMYYLPTFDSSDQYVGRVRDCALVGGNSPRQQQAYNVIRMMMDTPITIMTQPQGYIPETYSPVNVELALQMVDDFDKLNQHLSITDMAGNLFFTLEKQRLTEDDKQQLCKVISGIEKLYLYDNRHTAIEEIYYSYANEYVNNNGSLNTKLCYFELMRAMNPESEKWDMTPEEIEAFLNEGTKE